MKLILKSYCLLFIVVVFIISCSKDVGELQKKSVPENCDSSSNYTYTNYVLGILNTNCTFSGCHNTGSVNGDFTSYAGIKLKVDNGTFSNRVLVTKDMPPNYTSGPSSLSDCDLIKLKKWINLGAPQ